MNIFNYLKSLFSHNNKYPVIRINNISPSNNLIKIIKPVVLNYAQQSNIQRGMYIAPEYDLYEIHKVCDIESIVRRAFTKKEDLMFKEGYCYTSTNIKFAQYIKTRFNQMAFATGIPHTELLKRISRSLIHTSNAFLVKVRDPKASGGSIRRTADGKIVKPIAGYFPAAPETMRVDINANTGAIQGWQQLLPGGLYKEFKPEDVIHFTRDRREGFLFGIPQLVPVIDDIRALRQLEEDIEIMLHQHIFPTFQYTVGTETAPAGYTEDGQKEIDIVKSTIDIMPTEGVIITPERHKIESIRSDVAVDANNYLIHFKKRILAGLGVSSIDMGEAECYDEETETLTENGWKKHNEIDHLSERIATFNPDTQQIEFNLANSKYEGVYKGYMVNFTGKHLDIKVTPHHEMWVAPKNDKKPLSWQKVYAGDLLNGKFSEFYMLDSVKFIEEENYDLKIHLPCNAIKTGKAKDINCNISDFASLLGYYISEGCLDKFNGNLGAYRVLISQNKGPILDKIINSAKRCGISYSLINNNSRPNFSGVKLYSKALYSFINTMCPGLCHKKYIPEIVWSWNYEARKNLLDALIEGDGTTSKQIGSTSKTYYTTSEQLANDVQILALSLGLSAKIKLTKQSEKSFSKGKNYIYRVHISGKYENNSNKRLVNKSNISFDYYIGNIYCYNVPNHLFVTRRNGKVTIQGNTSNRSTSFTMSKAIMDSVKAIQADLEEQWSQYVITELLLESTFDDINILDDNDKVSLSFYEIDLMNKIDKEKHAIELFKANGLTFDEFRTELGKEPILLPENPEDQDHTKSPRWFNTYWKVFEEPTLLIKAIDEGYLASTYALASTPSSSVTSQQINYGQQLVAKTIQQEKQVKRQDSIIKYTSEIDNLFNDIKTMDINKDNLSYLKSIIRTFTTDLSNKLSINCVNKCAESFQIYTSLLDTDLIQIKVANNEINKRIDFFIKRLLDSIIYSIDKKIINGIITKDNLQNIFDVSKYRLNLIYNTEIIKSDNYGVVLGIKHLNHYGIKLVNNNIDACDVCKSLNNKQYHHSLLTLENLPPFHPHSRTTVESIITNKD